MKEFDTASACREFIQDRKGHGDTVSFVPTMGALHNGHRACIDLARSCGDLIVTSIFVNPTQFGPNEDLDRYPSNRAADLELCRAWNCDVVFCPGVDEVYPGGEPKWIDPGPLAETLCGRSRPGHFRGVTTVVARLLDIVRPDVAVFGQKDAQQALVIRDMVRRLGLPVELKVAPTVRDADGLALSSRNAYLSPAERKIALALPGGLEAALDMLAAGARDPAAVRDAAIRHMESRGLDVEYVELVDVKKLRPMDRIRGKVLLAAAARVGVTRLIDNRVVRVTGKDAEPAALF